MTSPRPSRATTALRTVADPGIRRRDDGPGLTGAERVDAARTAFEPRLDIPAANALVDAALAGSLPMPEHVILAEPGALGPGNTSLYHPGGGGTVYIDRAALADPETLSRTLAETCGRQLDTLLGSGGRVGDEAATFARSRLGEASAPSVPGPRADYPGRRFEDLAPMIVAGRTGATSAEATSDDAVASGAGPGPTDAAPIADRYRTNDHPDTEALAGAIHAKAGGDAALVATLTDDLAGSLGPLERGEFALALGRQDGIGLGEHVADGVVEFGKDVWGAVRVTAVRRHGRGGGADRRAVRTVRHTAPRGAAALD